MKNTVTVTNRILADTLTYNNTPILQYSIQYPAFTSHTFHKTLKPINEHYKGEAQKLQAYCRYNLYLEALKMYHESKKNGYPVMTYEMVTQYQVTYNQNCTISLYTDQYLYTGGAHGSTTRFGDTWNLRTGNRIALDQLTVKDNYADEYFLAYVIWQIRSQIEAGNEAGYFDDYRNNAREGFDPKQFYLNDQGAVIFYQQYAIAPYSSGILTFLIPYSKTVREPSCRRK